jgi:hypothetical protein
MCGYVEQHSVLTTDGGGELGSDASLGDGVNALAGEARTKGMGAWVVAAAWQRS